MVTVYHSGFLMSCDLLEIGLLGTILMGWKQVISFLLLGSDLINGREIKSGMEKESAVQYEGSETTWFSSCVFGYPAPTTRPAELRPTYIYGIPRRYWITLERIRHQVTVVNTSRWDGLQTVY